MFRLTINFYSTGGLKYQLIGILLVATLLILTNKSKKYKMSLIGNSGVIYNGGSSVKNGGMILQEVII